MPDAGDPRCCECVYQDSGEPIKTLHRFFEGCWVESLSPRDWMGMQGCTKVDIIPLSQFSKISHLKCSSLTIAYNGHAKAMHLDDFMANCSKYSPANCVGGLCAFSDACGIPEDLAKLERDKNQIAALLKKFGKLQIYANQTTSAMSETYWNGTAMALDFSCRTPQNVLPESVDNITTQKRYKRCFAENKVCSPNEEYYVWKGKKRHYRNYWQCLDSKGYLATQTCCGSTKKSDGKWSAAGQKCK